ncbi:MULTISPECIES: kelch repeat-containing protein [unclassified Streptomyces]|uniref:Kelch repeat-containing protein n=1 Tax=unclassified Streptomyces TaxID=2593676 RepID=UPI0011A56878|nr:kelch repeat-containing protein [Streptomyces sp. BK340]TVZ83175.1 Kelch motif protein [Streptomyces sp. BK340]
MTSPTPTAVGSWTKTGALPAAAGWHGQDDGAVLLKNAKGVLLVGGSDTASAATNRTNVYDLTKREWKAGSPLAFPRRLHTVTVLDSGKVLVTGGTGGSGPHPAGLAAVELYDPVQGTWKTVAGLREARWGHAAVLLEGGKVLVTGGSTSRSGDSVRALASAEIFDPKGDPDDPDKGSWTPAAPMTDARTGHCALVFKGGKVLVAGGTAPVSPTGVAALAYCEVYDPGAGPAGAWTPVASLSEPRSGHRAVLASDTAALVVGGATPGTAGDGTYDPYDELTVERFDLASGKWTARPSTPGGRALHRVVPLGSAKFLVVGGTTDDGNGIGYQSALVYDDNGPGGWSTAAGLAEGRWAFAATALDAGTVLVTGGTLASGVAAADPTKAELTMTTEVFTLTGGGS